MNKWLALLLIVISVILGKHIMAWISLKKLATEENIAEHNKKIAEAKQLTAQLQKQTAECISAMSQEQIAAYNNVMAYNCGTCQRNTLSTYALSQQVISRHF